MIFTIGSPDRLPVAVEAAGAGEHDRAVAGEPVRELVGVVVAGDEHERAAGVDDAADDACLHRTAAVGQVAGEEDGALGGGPLEDRDRDDVVVEVRGEREARAVLERGAVAGRGDEAREADELGVELLVERPRAALGGLDRAERARDVGAEGVVLRGVDLAARREEDDERGCG